MQKNGKKTKKSKFWLNFCFFEGLVRRAIDRSLQVEVIVSLWHICSQFKAYS